MPATVVERWGSLSATGFIKENAFGTALTPTTFLPMSGNSLERDPGLFSPKVMMGQRDVNVFPLQGQFKNSGGIDAPLFPTQSIALLAGAIGTDAAAGNGVTGTAAASPSPTTLNGGVSAGASSITLQSATGYAIGDVIQIDVNGAGPVTTAECRKISNLVTTTATLDVALSYAHLTGVAVKRLQTPYTHTITQSTSLPSFTIEKNLGSAQSLVFAGTRIGKLTVSASASNAEVQMKADVVAKSSVVQATPTALSYVDESPYVFAETTVSLWGNAVAQASSVELTIENGLKDTFTFNSSHNLQFLTPVTLKVSGKADLVFYSLDDTDWGWWTKAGNKTEGAVQVAFTHPSSAGAVTFNLPRAVIRTTGDAVKMEDIILTTVNFDAYLKLSTLQTVGATVVNSAYLPY